MSKIEDFQVVRTVKCTTMLYDCHDTGLPEPDTSFREREVFEDNECYGCDEDYYYNGDELQFTNGKVKAETRGYSGILIHKQEGIMPILRHEGEEVHYIDDIPCIVRSIHDDWLAVDVISTEDFTTKRAFVAKVNGVVAHGDTLRDAIQAAHDKFMASLNREERCKMFKEQFPELNKLYKAMDFFNWHGTVTGSCSFGRTEFANRKKINIETDVLTVNEFFALTDKEYGSDTIALLKTYYEQH